MIAFSQLISMLPPSHLTPLQDSSVVRESSCPFPTVSAVGGDGEAVGPITQGAVQWVNECAEALIALDIYALWIRWIS